MRVVISTLGNQDKPTTNDTIASNTMAVEALAKGGSLDWRHPYKSTLPMKMVSKSERH
jgi:hypothetical protein